MIGSSFRFKKTSTQKSLLQIGDIDLATAITKTGIFYRQLPQSYPKLDPKDVPTDFDSIMVKKSQDSEDFDVQLFLSDLAPFDIFLYFTKELIANKDRVTQYLITRIQSEMKPKLASSIPQQNRFFNRMNRLGLAASGYFPLEFEKFLQFKF